MARISIELWNDDLETGENASHNPGRQQPPLVKMKQGSKRGKRIKRATHAVLDEIATHQELGEVTSESYFNPTFSSSRHEREWIFTYLGLFYEQKLISDVLKKVKGGKEANVYCCLAHPDTGLDLIAAKIYRPRMFRNLRNDGRYRQNREILDSDGKTIHDHGLLHAVRKGTQIGKDVAHTSWLEHEYRTLQILYQAGAEVPRPLACSQNTILMEYIGDVDLPAPTLNQVSLPKEEAVGLYERLMHNVGLMLDCHRIHADLSAYNVLYWEGRIKIIDFPQAVDPRTNAEAYDLLERDITRLCQYFRNSSIRSDPVQLAHEIWAKYASREKVATEPDPQDEEIDDLLG